ncbi:hypothetical protein D9M71_542380 [compost metagenome]
MAQHRLELGWFANDAQHRFDRTLLEGLEQGAHAQAADFLVVGQGDMHRQAQRGLHQRGHQGEHAGDVALHVRRTATVQQPIALGELERRDGPRLAVDRDHVGVPREHDAWPVRRADRGKQIGLAALLVVDQLARHIETCEVVADKLDQLQVGFAAGGVERHQRCEQIAAGAHRSSPATP